MPKDTISQWIDNLSDPAAQEIKRELQRVATLPTSVFLYGETGTGKDAWVEYLYQLSGLPCLVNLHCGDVPETLLESEWFGYVRGAFTNADRDYQGKWRTAEGGLLYLNQIDLLPLALQAKLLRIIERKSFYPLGSNQEVTINCRIVYSADSAIEKKVRLGEFRSDLFYRITAYKIFIPPLRERRADISALLEFFCRRSGISQHLTAAEKQMLLNYTWPGNIRELEHFINAVAITDKELDGSALAKLTQRPASFLEQALASEIPLAELEHSYIEQLLKKYGNKTRVAAILGIARKTLYNILQRHEKH